MKNGKQRLAGSISIRAASRTNAGGPTGFDYPVPTRLTLRMVTWLQPRIEHRHDL